MHTSQALQEQFRFAVFSCSIETAEAGFVAQGVNNRCALVFKC